ncbi:hypothetical protein VPHK397_0145 [Vibrio phage K397]|nr:hypothetical protein MYOV002v2_p0137 [Vibrio phage 144E46.1]
MQIKIDNHGIIWIVEGSINEPVGQLAQVGRDYIFNPSNIGRRDFGLTAKTFPEKENVAERCLQWLVSYELKCDSITYKDDSGWVTKARFLCEPRKLEELRIHKWGVMEPVQQQIENFVRESKAEVRKLNSSINTVMR